MASQCRIIFGDREKVKMETGSRISIWRPFVLESGSGSSDISAVD